MEEQDKVKYQELKERTENVLFDNVKGQIDVSKHRQLIVDIVDTVGKDVEKITDNSTDMNQKFEEYKESQSELNAKQDIDINKNLQNINQLNDMIKVLSQKDEPIMKANGGGVISLPNNAMKSVVPKYKFEGLTLKNEILGDFSKENSDLNPSNSWFDSSISEEGMLISFKEREGSYQNTMANLTSRDNFREGDVLALVLNAKMISGTSKTLTLSVLNCMLQDNSNVSVSAGEDFSYVRIANFTGSDNPSNIIIWRIIRGSSTTSANDTFLYKSAMVINLTQTFGAGNEPSKEWCDANLPDYFEGVKSVQTPMRIKSVGENLFNKNTITKDKFINILGSQYYGMKVHLEPNTDYYINVRRKNDYKGTEGLLIIDSVWNLAIMEYCSILHKDFATKNNINFKLNTGDKDYLVIKGQYINSINMEKMLLNTEISITKKPIKEDLELPKYTESNLYINNQLELKSVGEVKDYIEDGKLYKNVSDDVYIDDIKYIYNVTEKDFENIYIIHISGNLGIGKLAGGGYESIISLNLPNIYNYGLDKPHFYVLNGSMYLYLDKDLFNNTLPSKQDVLNYLVDNKVFVRGELKNKEIINLDTSGLITNHPNGTIFIEPIINITAYYNDGLDVSNFNIESVKEFAIFKDGNYQNLDVSKIKITDNKLTHPDAINGLCYLVFRYDNAPIFGDNEVEYYNNDGILVSPDGTFWKPVLTVDDEGNVLMKGEKL